MLNTTCRTDIYPCLYPSPSAEPAAKPATRTHWGIAGYFTDPDGHLFEVDYEQTWVFDAQHRLLVDCLHQWPIKLLGRCSACAG